jgi:hypothetical protein
VVVLDGFHASRSFLVAHLDDPPRSGGSPKGGAGAYGSRIQISAPQNMVAEDSRRRKRSFVKIQILCEALGGGAPRPTS